MQASGNDLGQLCAIAAHHGNIARVIKPLPVFLGRAVARPIQPVPSRSGQIGGERAEGPRVALSKRMDRIKLAVIESQSRGESGRVQSLQFPFSLELGKGLFQRAGNILRRPIGDGESGAVLGHDADAVAKLACPRVDVAEDAAMGFFEAFGVERGP